MTIPFKALIFVAATCAGPDVNECYVIPHPTNANKAVLEVCGKFGEPTITYFRSDTVPIYEIKTIHKADVMCSSKNRPRDNLHWMQVQ